MVLPKRPALGTPRLLPFVVNEDRLINKVSHFGAANHCFSIPNLFVLVVFLGACGFPHAFAQSLGFLYISLIFFSSVASDCFFYSLSCVLSLGCFDLGLFFSSSSH